MQCQVMTVPGLLQLWQFDEAAVGVDAAIAWAAPRCAASCCGCGEEEVVVVVVWAACMRRTASWCNASCRARCSLHAHTGTRAHAHAHAHL